MTKVDCAFVKTVVVVVVKLLFSKAETIVTRSHLLMRPQVTFGLPPGPWAEIGAAASGEEKDLGLGGRVF